MLKSGTAGFTLLEMMLVLLLGSILAGMAWSAYRQHVVAAQRAEAITLLQKNATYLEGIYLRTGSYKASPTAWPVLPYRQSPEQGSTIRYQLAFGSTPRNTDDGYFLLRATAIDPEYDDEVISLTQTGVLKTCIQRDGVEHCTLS